MSVTLAQLARDLGYKGALPKGATGINKNPDGTYSITANGQTKTYDATGSLFSANNGDGNNSVALQSDRANQAAVNDGRSLNGTSNNDNNINSNGLANGNALGNANAVGNNANNALGNGMGVGSGASPSAFGYGFNPDTSGDIGMGTFNAGYEIDPQKFMQSSMGLNALVNLTGSLPFGLGDLFTQGAMANVMNSFMNSVKFNFDFSNFDNKNNSTGTTQVAQDVSPNQVAEAETPVQAPQVQEEPAETVYGTTANDVPEAQTPAKTSAKIPVKKSPAELAKENGYRTTDNANTFYDPKTKTHYQYDKNTGKLVERPDIKQIAKDGSYIGKDGNAYNAKGKLIRENAVAGKSGKDFSTRFNETSTPENLSKFAKDNWTHNEISNVLKNSDNFSIKSDGDGSISVTDGNTKKTMSFKFDKNGKVTKMGQSYGNYGGNVANIKYHDNGKIAEIKSVSSGQSSITSKYDENGNMTSQESAKWMQNSEGGAFIPQSKTTYGKRNLGNVAQYLPKFDISTEGYEKPVFSKHAKINTKAGTWSQTDNANQYHFSSTDGKSEYTVDARSGDILNRTTYDKKGGEIVKQEDQNKSVEIYTKSQQLKMLNNNVKNKKGA